MKGKGCKERGLVDWASLKQWQLSRSLKQKLGLSRCRSGVHLEGGGTSGREVIFPCVQLQAGFCLETSPWGPRNGMALGGQRSAERRKQGKLSWLFREQCLEGRPALLYFYWDSRDLYFENKTIFKLFIFSKIGYFLFFFEAQKSVLWKSLTDLAVPRNRGVCLY